MESVKKFISVTKDILQYALLVEVVVLTIQFFITNVEQKISNNKAENK